VRRVNFEIYWLPVDALVIPRYSCGLVLNFPLNILKFCESSIRYVVELGPFWLCCYRCPCVWFRTIVVSGDVDELEDERPSSNDTTAPGQEISANYVLEDGGLPR
jgi:hypothetical protein